MFYEYRIMIFLMPVIASIVLFILIYGRNKLSKKTYPFKHPLARYVLSHVKRQKKLKLVISIALSLLLVSMISYSLSMPYILVPKNVKTTQTLEARISLQRKPPVVILIDSSGSMKGEKIYNAIRAANIFIDKTIDKILVGLISFADHIKSSVPPTSDAELLYKKLGEIKAYGGTIYSKPLEMAYRWLLPYTEFNLSSSIILVTDGLPFSQDIPLYRDIVYKCAKANITIYTIYIETPGSDIYQSIVAKQRLKEISYVTHGEFFNVKQVDKLVDIFEQLAEKTLRQSGKYVLTSNINYAVDVKTYVVDQYILVAVALSLINILARFLIYRSTL